MAQEHSPKLKMVSPWDIDAVYLMLGDPFRRQIILSLSKGESKTGMELNAASGRKGPAVRAQLSELCEAGILVKKENPKDRRLPLFSLAQGVRVRIDESTISVKIGRCMVRFRRDR